MRTPAGVLFAGALVFNFCLNTESARASFMNLEFIASAAQAQSETNPSVPCISGAGGCCIGDSIFPNYREYMW